MSKNIFLRQYNNIVIEPTKMNQPTTKKKYFDEYKSPNIVIVPTASICNPPSPKRIKLDTISPNQSPEHTDISFLDDFNIDEIVACLNNCDNKQETESNNEINQTSQSEPIEQIVLNKNDLMKPHEDFINTDTNIVDNIEHYLKPVENKNLTNIKTNDYECVEKNNKIVLEIDKRSKKLNDQSSTQSNACESVENDIDNCIIININVDLAVNGCQDVKKSLKSQNTTENKTIIKDENAESGKTKSNTSKVTNGVEERKKLGKKSKTTLDKTFMEENKISGAKPKTTIDITSIEEMKKLEVVDKPHTKLIKAKTSDDKKIFKTKISKSSIASAKTDVLELIKLEQQMYNVLHKTFKVLYTIHYGNYSKIFKCKDSIGELYAVKMLKKKCDKVHESSKKRMLQNIQLDIPKKNFFCVYLYESFVFNGHWCFLQEYYPKNLNEALEESAKPFNINRTQYLASQLAGAVLLLRNNNIVHSDIKPSHILLNSTNSKLKLCGFDNAYYLNNNTLSNTGSLNYLPPEVILGYPAGFSIDVWSTALVLFKMVTGNKLFPGYSKNDMLYTQMKVLGSIPEEMRRISSFRDKYFRRDKFLKLSHNKKCLRLISINDFTGDNTIQDTVHDVHTKHWGTTEKDQKKLDMFLNLLKKMLVLHPKRRLSIEFVCANPFIYEFFSI